MTLVPLDGVASVVAKIAKQDPETARVYAQLGLYEVLCDIIDVYRPELDQHVIKSIGAGADLARRELVREFVERRVNGEGVTDLLTAARGLDELDSQIAKAAGDYVEREHRRDPYTGRWVVMLNSPNNHVERAHEAAQVMDEWRRSGLVGHGQHVIVADAKGNQNSHQLKQSLPADRQALESLTNGSGKKALPFVAHQVELSPGQSTRASGPPGGTRSNQSDLFDAMDYATGSPVTAARVTPSIARTQAGLEDLVGGPDHPAFRTLRAGGAALQAVSVPGSGSHAAGAVAQLSGHLGPEAQRILGPGFARLAYKYRGTERTPDKNLVVDVRNATRFADLAGKPGTDSKGNRNPVATSANPYKIPSLGAGQKWAGQAGAGMTADQRRLLVRGDAAVAYFIDQMPSLEQADLSIAAGRVPPSVGAIIDADGDVVSEAMGTGEDHYLPFDLKNLKELSGGQYVRTRLAGGPTTEDIYTGLLTGTRQLQVVSHSGVFTLEFDPDLRGGRRYSDKARQMVGRYEAMLKTIAGGGVLERDVSPERMATLRGEAIRRAGGENYDPQMARTELKRLQEEERNRSGFMSEADEDELRVASQREAAQNAPAGVSPEWLESHAEQIFEAKQRSLKDTQVRSLQLDGVGYFRAMQALKQEFPYFIRNVSWEPMQGGEGFLATRGLDPVRDSSRSTADEPVRSRVRMPDRGYVQPGYINAGTGKEYSKPKSPVGATARFSSGGTSQAAPTPQGGEGGNGSGGAGGGGGAGPTPERAPGRPETQAAGKYAEEPDNEKVLVPNVNGGVPTKLEDLGKADSKIAEDAQNALSDVDIALSGTQLGGNPSEADVRNPERVSNAADYVHAVMNHGGDIGPRKAVGYFLQPGHDLAKFIEGLRQIDEDMTAKAASIDPEGVALRARVPSERFTEAIKNLQLLGRLNKPFSDPSGPVHEHAPANEDAPLRFADVESLGNDVGRYAAFRQAASPRLQAAIAGMERLKPEDRPAAVRKLVSEYKRAQDFAKKDPMAVPVQGLPAGVSTPRQAEVWLQNGPEKDIRAAHKAWAFAHAHEIAAEIAPPKPPAGGGGSPLVPGPAGPAQPQVSVLHKQAKRLDQPRKLIVHPPGSPVAKALARVRSTR